MEIKLATKNDLLALTNISKNAFHTDQFFGGNINDGPPGYDSLDWHTQMLKEKHLYKALNQNEILGGVVLFLNQKELFIGRIFIDPMHFQKGYGISLMQAIEKHFSPLIDKIQLNTPIWNYRTIAFYNKLGYIEKSRDHESVYFQKEINS